MNVNIKLPKMFIIPYFWRLCDICYWTCFPFFVLGPQVFLAPAFLLSLYFCIKDLETMSYCVDLSDYFITCKKWFSPCPVSLLSNLNVLYQPQLSPTISTVFPFTDSFALNSCKADVFEYYLNLAVVHLHMTWTYCFSPPFWSLQLEFFLASSFDCIRAFLAFGAIALLCIFIRL